MPGRMPQQIAVAFALCAFMVSVGAGLVSSVAPNTVLMRSLVALIIGYPIGRVLGAALRVALNEHLTAVAAAHPIPEAVALRGAAPGGQGDVDIIEDVESL